jgi:hypothetical protein
MIWYILVGSFGALVVYFWRRLVVEDAPANADDDNDETTIALHAKTGKSTSSQVSRVGLNARADADHVRNRLNDESSTDDEEWCDKAVNGWRAWTASGRDQTGTGQGAAARDGGRCYERCCRRETCGEHCASAAGQCCGECVGSTDEASAFNARRPV